LQKPHTSPRPGDLVRVRGHPWRVEQVAAYDNCVALHLAGIGANNVGVRQAVLHPFDRPEPLDRRGRPTLVRRDLWLRALDAVAATTVPWGSLRAAAGARIDLLPYQFEPALALVRGLASRVLIADAVGLGKTIQAALVIAELKARDESARALVVTPAGLREQWAQELDRRFSIPALIIDALQLRRATRSLPADINPWEIAPVVITSLDFVKLPEVSRALDATLWDLVVVDEAHMAATARERRLAIDGLGARARWVVLLTATPHAGDESGFASLCSLGDPERRGPILMFRRTAGDVGLVRDRRIHLLRVTLTRAEAELHALLNRYTRLVWERAGTDERRDARLAMIVLRKRALSSVASLMRSVEHRLVHLQDDAAPVELQLLLPMADERDGEHDPDDLVPRAALACAGLTDVEEERRWLAGILDAARLALGRDSKIAALVRLLGRIAEPAIVFTEYRDTAAAIAGPLASLGPVAVLHGGLDRGERCDIEERFRAGLVRILVATDAAGQGLNLQERCRVVVNLELPWNPMRLEQRIGRVDRIGQARRVHAFNLVARGSAEETVLARLAARIAAVRDSIGWAGSPIGSSARIAAAMIAPQEADAAAGLWASSVPFSRVAPTMKLTAAPPPEISSIAVHELERLLRLRTLDSTRERLPWWRASSLMALLEGSAPWAHVISARGAVAPGVVFLFRARLIDGRGGVLEDMLIPIHAESTSHPSGPTGAPGARESLDQVANHWLPVVRERARAEAAARLSRLLSQQAGGFEHLRAREAAIARFLRRHLRPGAMVPAQAGLFDRRELRQAAARRLAWSRMEEALRERRGRPPDGSAGSQSGEPELMLMLWVTQP
jgi:superfamily II DNA or RNA helicase